MVKVMLVMDTLKTKCIRGEVIIPMTCMGHTIMTEVTANILIIHLMLNTVNPLPQVMGK